MQGHKESELASSLSRKAGESIFFYTKRQNWKGGWSFFFVAEAKDLHAAHHDGAIIFLVTAK
jgi:hypothetical protein